MRVLSVSNLVLCGVVGLMFLQGCEENPTDPPQLGSGDILTATIDGENYTFELESALSTYDTVLEFGNVSGSVNSFPVQSLTLSFSHDIDGGAIPVTLGHPQGRITLVLSDTSGGADIVYQTVNEGEVSVTLSATDGTIVDGTFSGTLENTRDSNDKVTVTNGTFSARLNRE